MASLKNTLGRGQPVAENMCTAPTPLRSSLLGNERVQHMMSEGYGGVLNTSGEALMSPGLLAESQETAAEDPRWRPRNKTTYCNFATNEVAKGMGNNDLDTVTGKSAGLANNLNAYFGGEGPQKPYEGFTHDYRDVGVDRGADLSAAGGLVLHSTAAAGHGHITTGAGRNADGEALTAHVGAGAAGVRTLPKAHGRSMDTLHTMATTELDDAYSRGLRSQENQLLVANPEAPAMCQPAPNQSFASPAAAKKFYGDRVSDVIPMTQP